MDFISYKCTVPLEFNSSGIMQVIGVIRSAIESNWRELADEWSEPTPLFESISVSAAKSDSCNWLLSFSPTSQYNADLVMLPEEDGSIGLGLYFPKRILFEDLDEREMLRMGALGDLSVLDTDNDEVSQKLELLGSLGSARNLNLRAAANVISKIEKVLGVTGIKVSEELRGSSASNE